MQIFFTLKKSTIYKSRRLWEKLKKFISRTIFLQKNEKWNFRRYYFSSMWKEIVKRYWCNLKTKGWLLYKSIRHDHTKLSQLDRKPIWIFVFVVFYFWDKTLQRVKFRAGCINRKTASPAASWENNSSIVSNLSIISPKNEWEQMLLVINIILMYKKGTHVSLLPNFLFLQQEWETRNWFH